MKGLSKLLWLILLAAVLTGCGSSAPEKNAPDPVETQPITTAPQETPQPSEDLRLPEGSLLFGAVLSGLTVDEALQLVRKTLELYTLTLSVEGTEMSFSAAELDLSCNDTELRSYLDDLASGSTEVVPPQVQFDLSGLTQALHTELDKNVRNAGLVFDSGTASFVIRGEVAGQTVIPESVLPTVEDAVAQLQAAVQTSAQFQPVPPSLTKDSQTMQDALVQANRLLDTKLQYTYTPVGGETAEEVLDRTIIGSLLTVMNDGRTVAVDRNALSRYVDKMDSIHSVPDVKGQFKTTGGIYLNSMIVTYEGQRINRDALFSDLEECITNCISGVRTAPYIPKTPGSDLPYGGNYVEVDLDSQHIWTYRDGVCVVSSPIVSGNVETLNMTPTGVYSIRKKATDTWLVGPTWRDWVSFWMPFYGSYGLHDADGWRTQYGGDIYLRNGSHGCVNLPHEAARGIYENVSVGTKVILYGGATSLELLEQTLTGTTSYMVDMGAAPFALNVTASYPGCAMTYTSSDELVAVVDPSGVVSVVGAGTCTITVKAAPNGQYTGADLDILVTVGFPCDRDGHLFDPITSQCIYGCGTQSPENLPGKDSEQSLQPEEPEVPAESETPMEVESFTQ